MFEARCMLQDVVCSMQFLDRMLQGVVHMMQFLKCMLQGVVCMTQFLERMLQYLESYFRCIEMHRPQTT